MHARRRVRIRRDVKLKPYPRTIREIEIAARYMAVIKRLWKRARRYRRQLREVKHKLQHFRAVVVEDDNLRFKEVSASIRVIEQYEDLLADTVQGYEPQYPSYVEYKHYLKSEINDYWVWRERYMPLVEF